MGIIMNKEKRLELKSWNTPKITKLSVDSTKGGAKSSDKENPQFHS